MNIIIEHLFMNSKLSLTHSVKELLPNQEKNSNQKLLSR